MTPKMHQATHLDSVRIDVLGEGRALTVPCSRILEWHEATQRDSCWIRGEFLSVWIGPDIELIVVQSGGPSESWHWTARGWRKPDDDWGSDQDGWVETGSREAAEKAAMAFYLEKDE